MTASQISSGSLLADRAVADIRKRGEWAKAREFGCGASDAASYAKETSIDSYVRAKLLPPWQGGESANWGDEREPIILAEFGYEQNHTMFHAIDNPRHLATPDGIKLGPRPRLAQAKTTNHPFVSKRTGAVMIPPNYRRQVWWEQWVMGPQFEETDFVWEVHDNYVPEPTPHLFVIERDDAEIAKLVRIANKVLHGLDLSRIDLTEI